MKTKKNRPIKSIFRNLLSLSLLAFAFVISALETPDKYSTNEEWKMARQAELQNRIDNAVRNGAKPSDITKIREEWMKENRAMESSRSRTLRDLIKEVYGVPDDKTAQKILETDFKHSGTKPEQGQGRFGDIDYTPKPEAWKKIRDYATKNPDKVRVRGGSVEILSQETTIHNPSKYYEYSVEIGPDGKVKIVEPGKDGAPVRRVDTVAMRAGDKESYTSYEYDKDGNIVIEDGASVGYDKNGNPVRKPGPKIADPHLNTLDNMKKIGEHLEKPGTFHYKNNQSTAKAVMRIIEGAYGSDPSKWPSDIADMHKKCFQVKSGIALEELGMTDKAAKNRFYDKMEETIKKSYEKTSAHSAKRDAELDTKRRQEWNEMQELKKKMGEMKRNGDDRGFKKTQEQLQQKMADYEKTSSKLTQKRSNEARAEHGVVKNKGATLLSKCKGKPVRTVESKNGQVVVQEVETRKVMTPTEFEAELTKDTTKRLVEALKPESLTTPSEKIKPLASKTSIFEPFSGRKAFFDKTSKLLDLYGAYQNYDLTGEALDLFLDTNPTFKKGVQTVTAGASLLALAENFEPLGRKLVGLPGIIAGAPGAIADGAEASIDEYAKWYLENPGAGDPNFFQRTGIGLRGANKYAMEYLKNTAYGVTLKPVEDLYQIVESGKGALEARLEKTATERKNRENKETMLATAEEKTFGPIREKFDSMEKEAKRILADKSSSQAAKEKAEALLKELEFGRRRLQEAIDEQRNRDVSGDFGGDYYEQDENKKHVEDLKAAKEREQAQKQRELTMKNLETAISNTEREMKSLSQIADSVRVKISVFDNETGSPLDAEVSIIGAKYRNLRKECRNGSVVFYEVPSGNYDISVIARGYEPKRVSYSFDSTKKKEYSGSFKLIKLPAEDTTPAFAKLTVFVVDAETGAAINGATISLESNDRNYSYSGSTPTGGMDFPSLASGNYFVSAGASGYQSKSGLKIPIDPAKNTSPRCRVTLIKSAQVQKADGTVDFGKVFDNTYVQTDDGIVRAGDLKKTGTNYEKLKEWRRIAHSEIENNYKSRCPNCGGTISMLLNSYVDEDFFKSRIFCNSCGWKLDMAKLRNEYDKYKNNVQQDETKKNEPQKNNKDEIKKQIEALRAEGNAKLDKIREELKKLEGKSIKMKCHICGNGGPHYWDGSGWTCPSCGATVCQPSKYPTSAGTYSQVREDYKRKIAELEAQLNK